MGRPKLHGIYSKDNINYCIDCNKIISAISKRCVSCAKIGSRNPARTRNFFGSNNPSYVDGHTLKKYYCKKCNKELGGYQTKSNLCRSCCQKQRLFNPKNHPNYKDGRTNKDNFCVDCNKKLGDYRHSRCLSCETKRRIKENIFCKIKNKPETLLETLLQKLFPNEYKFVGDGKVLIDFFNPDFVNCNGQKKIIELYGDYWHNIPKVKNRDYLRLKSYTGYGYDTLIVWEHELKNIENLKKRLIIFNSK